MGLLDFAVNFGLKLFGGDDNPAEKIRAHIEAANPGLSDLVVAFRDGVVTLSGRCDDPEAVEKAALMAGNIAGVERVDIDNVVAPKPEGAAVESEFYVIREGDTLSLLADQYYGDVTAWERIFEANREVIGDPDKIYPGQKIRIPG